MAKYTVQFEFAPMQTVRVKLTRQLGTVLVAGADGCALVYNVRHEGRAALLEKTWFYEDELEAIEMPTDKGETE